MTTRPKHWRDDLIRPDVRTTTNRVLEMIDEGLLDPKQVVLMGLKWMSEEEVKEMCKANELDLDQEDEFADLTCCK
jgi:hypothetical protein